MAEPFIHKEGKGSLFRFELKEKEEHPDFKGSFTAPCDIRKGEPMDISAWVNKTRDGKKKYFGLIIQKPYTEKVSPEKATPFTDMDDSIPF